MKIIHLTDPHIDPNLLDNIDSQERFKLALNHIVKNHFDANLFVITGDLTHFGKDESYLILKDILVESDLPEHLSPKLMIGNHDNRENLKNSFSHIPRDENGFIQYYTDIKDKKFIFLDTNLSGTDKGHFCNQRQQWLINILEESLEKNIYLLKNNILN